jgi:hypothetical protein
MFDKWAIEKPGADGKNNLIVDARRSTFGGRRNR